MIGDGVAGTPLLSPAIIEAVARRAKDLASIIDAKTTAHGEGETLYFP